MDARIIIAPTVVSVPSTGQNPRWAVFLETQFLGIRQITGDYASIDEAAIMAEAIREDIASAEIVTKEVLL